MIWLKFWLKALVGKISGADKKTAPLIWKPLYLTQTKANLNATVLPGIVMNNALQFASAALAPWPPRYPR